LKDYSDRLAEGFALLEDDPEPGPAIVEDLLPENRLVLQDRLWGKIRSCSFQTLRDEPSDCSEEMAEEARRVEELAAWRAMVLEEKKDEIDPWGFTFSMFDGVISVGISPSILEID
jgi:hypothetical protein